MQELERLKEAVVQGDAELAVEMAKKALAAGIDPLRLIHDYLAPAMDEVGRRYEQGEYFLPELVLASDAMQSVMSLIRPSLASAGQVRARIPVVIGTVRGDMHDIGKNLVAAMLEGAGFEVHDLGVDVQPEQFVEAAKATDARIVAMSALLTTTMGAMRDTIEALRAAGLRERVRVLVGGAPVTQRFADEIGADGYSENAPGAVKVARKVLNLND